MIHVKVILLIYSHLGRTCANFGSPVDTATVVTFREEFSRRLVELTLTLNGSVTIHWLTSFRKKKNNGAFACLLYVPWSAKSCEIWYVIKDINHWYE